MSFNKLLEVIVMRMMSTMCVFALGCGVGVPTVVSGTQAPAQKTVMGGQIHQATFDSGATTMLDATGLTTVRLGIPYLTWMTSQPNSATLWAPYDATVAELTDSTDIQHFNTSNHTKFILTVTVPVATLYGQLTAVYSSPTVAERDTFIPGKVQDDLNTVVTQAVGRYGSRIAGVEIWNEPDGTSSWNISELGTFSNAMTGICSKVSGWRVSKVYGFAFGTIPHSSSATTATNTLFDALNASGVNAFNCITNLDAHFYSKNPETLPQIYSDGNSVLTGKPLVITEYGGSWGYDSGRTEDGQAQLILRYMLTMFDVNPPLSSVYEWKDSSNAAPGLQQNYGMIDQYDAAKPAYTAFTNLYKIYANSTSGPSYYNCTSGLCQETLATPSYTYNVYWRTDATTSLLSAVVSAPTVSESKLSALSWATVAPSSVTVSGTPVITRQ